MTASLPLNSVHRSSRRASRPRATSMRMSESIRIAFNVPSSAAIPSAARADRHRDRIGRFDPSIFLRKPAWIAGDRQARTSISHEPPGEPDRRWRFPPAASGCGAFPKAHRPCKVEFVSWCTVYIIDKGRLRIFEFRPSKVRGSQLRLGSNITRRLKHKSRFEFRFSMADGSRAQLSSELVEWIKEPQAGEACEVPIAGGENRPVLDG